MMDQSSNRETSSSWTSPRTVRRPRLARKRNPLLINGEPVEIDAPGLKLIKRHASVTPWWVCSDEARRRGYEPRTVRLHFDLSVPAQVEQMASRCRVLTLEQAKWLEAPHSKTKIVYTGLLGSLIDCYQKDPESPYHTVDENTQRGYKDWCAVLKKEKGDRRVDRLTPKDVRRWFNELALPAFPGGPPRLARANKAVKTMLPMLLSYGAENRMRNCLELKQELEAMVLKHPPEIKAAWIAAKPQRTIMTYEHAEAIVTAALAMGTIRHRSIALGVAGQFDFTVAQIDMIGSFSQRRIQIIGPDDITRSGRRWKPGLRYEDFLPNMIWDMARNKTGVGAAFDVAEYPLFGLALGAVPEDGRTGPVVIDDDGLPMPRRRYVKLYGEVCEAAGVPKSVQNMLARHGGGSEGRASGASAEDNTRHLQKTDVVGAERDYIQQTDAKLEITRRVIRKRVERRNAIRNAPPNGSKVAG